MRRRFMVADEKLNVDNYLTMAALEDGMTVSFTTNKIQYSIDGSTTWNDLAVGASTPAINTGQVISFKAEGLVPNSSSGIGTFSVSKNYDLKGNVMSMVYGDNADKMTELTNAYQFYRLFFGSKTLQTVSKDFVPATTLSDYCYFMMFDGCSSLSTTPNLPAMVMKNHCYGDMFYGTNITSAPELPSTTLAVGCYYGMFCDCKGLTTLPNLPARTLAERCYASMFQQCRNLVNVPSDYLPVTKLEEQCYWQMFCYCDKLATLPNLPATTLARSCYNGMFAHSFALTSIPNNYLPATTLAQGCYQNMFYNCRALKTVPTNLLPATILGGQRCYDGMFEDCVSLTNAPDLPATDMITNPCSWCYCRMFKGCISLTKAPVLPAKILTTYCYQEMFKGCTKLNYIKMMATQLNEGTSDWYTIDLCFENWVEGVASSGTFVKSSSNNWLTRGVSGIPSGWTVQNA